MNQLLLIFVFLLTFVSSEPYTGLSKKEADEQRKAKKRGYEKVDGKWRKIQKTSTFL